MTVCIGMYGIGGLLVCADSHVITGDDGIVSSTCKLGGVQCGSGSFVIGNAADDGNAANMLATEIIEALSKSSASRGNIEPIVKKVMKDWHSGYVHSKAPQIHFALAARFAPQNRCLYFCEPPNTVLRKHVDETVVIGVGASIVEPLLPQVILGPLWMREALIRAGYLMYRAKKAHIFLKGSDTDVLMISDADGDIRQVTREEMKGAEAIGPDVDFMLRYCYLGLLGQFPGCDQKDFLEGLNQKYLEGRAKADAIAFPSLKGMRGYVQN